MLMRNAYVLVLSCVLLAMTNGCARLTPEPVDDHASVSALAGVRPSLVRLRHQIDPSLRQHVPGGETTTRAALRDGARIPVSFLSPFVLRVLEDPWSGLIEMEEWGYRLAQHADSDTQWRAEGFQMDSTNINGLIADAPVRPTGGDLEAHLSYVEAVLLVAQKLRSQALAALSLDEQDFLFRHADSLVEHFYPQLSELTLQEQARIEADWRFGQLYANRVSHDSLLAAAEQLMRFSDTDWLDDLARSWDEPSVEANSYDGVTGDVLAVRETAAGLIIIGGPKKNRYELGRNVAVVIDVGGNDVYFGRAGASNSLNVGNSVVIDISGDDAYHPDPLGLGTGRLGVGVLIDREGNDVYHLAPGSGGVGLGGVGILLDMSGRDRYVGTKLTQGAGIAGLGLLIDRAGQDQFTSFGYALGFGGPLGMGVVIDGSGHDSYVCGDKYPSSYNATDAPNAQPGEVQYQYDGFCIGSGVGVRLLLDQPYQFAGGLGVLIDVRGDDRYHSANFSQGVGYFFGVGLKLDLNGDDLHGAARYGHGAAAHQGVGVFMDATGSDEYASTGPVFNGGTAWDKSVALFVDAGVEDDVYDLSRSDGLGRAAHGSWSLFLEEQGNERYILGKGLGLASEESMSAFFDLGGKDLYTIHDPQQSESRGDTRIWTDGQGLFVDR